MAQAVSRRRAVPAAPERAGEAAEIERLESHRADGGAGAPSWRETAKWAAAYHGERADRRHRQRAAEPARWAAICSVAGVTAEEARAGACAAADGGLPEVAVQCQDPVAGFRRAARRDHGRDAGGLRAESAAGVLCGGRAVRRGGNRVFRRASRAGALRAGAIRQRAQLQENDAGARVRRDRAAAGAACCGDMEREGFLVDADALRGAGRGISGAHRAADRRNRGADGRARST